MLQGDSQSRAHRSLAPPVARGAIGRGPRLELAPLRLDVELEVDPALAGMLESGGVPVGPDGTGRIRVSGTLAEPRLP